VPSIAPRTISADEVAVIRRVLEVGAKREVPAELLATIESVKVVTACDCGKCPTVYFAAALAEAEYEPPLGQATALDDAGDLVGILVWARGDQLTGLEVFGYGQDPPPFLPKIETIGRGAER
jgi:hypothetical protein